jgi:hypothetical protein
LRNFLDPRHKFCATVINGTSEVSCNTMATPAAEASVGVAKVVSTPLWNIFP